MTTLATTFGLLLNHLNEINPLTKFAMEVEGNQQLQFLDVLIKKKPSGGITHTLCIENRPILIGISTVNLINIVVLGNSGRYVEHESPDLSG